MIDGIKLNEIPLSYPLTLIIDNKMWYRKEAEIRIRSILNKENLIKKLLNVQLSEVVIEDKEKIMIENFDSINQA